ncbi:MAG: hypothetical protein K1X51_00855 [Rhodospirillaceae bacterium]|nr:hypothetical protein [Rhodospirillaceae bacterium]
MSVAAALTALDAHLLRPGAACGVVEDRGALRFPGDIPKYVHIPGE